MRNQVQFLEIKDPRNLGRSMEFSTAQRPRWIFSNGGFTMVELIVVATILSALVIMAIPAYNKMVEAAKIPRAVGEIRALEKDIYAYFIDNSVYPNTLNDVGRGSLLDPWGNPYQYLNGGGGRTDKFLNPLNEVEDFDLYSMGRDGSSQPSISDPQSLDDVLRTGEGSWVGLAAKYYD